MKKYLLFTAILLIGLTSCGPQTFFQIYEVKSDDVTLKEQVMEFENAECLIAYNTWAESGTMNFMFQNKTDKNIYLQMPQSFFIVNGVAENYYSGITISKSTSSLLSYWNSGTKSFSSGNSSTQVGKGFLEISQTDRKNKGYSQTEGMGITHSEGQTITTKQTEVICIPPQSSKVIDSFTLINGIYLNHNKQMDYPDSVAHPYTFTTETSPLKIRNRIAYSFDEKGAETKFIENNFWLSSYQNQSIKHALQKQSNANKQTLWIFTSYAPNKFYNEYKHK